MRQTISQMVRSGIRNGPETQINVIGSVVQDRKGEHVKDPKEIYRHKDLKFGARIDGEVCGLN